MNINYLDIIKKAWTITWQNKYLWWFGLFIALTSVSSYSNYTFPDSSEKSALLQEKILNFVDQYIAIIIVSAITLFVIFIALSLLSIIGRGALIKSIYTAANPPAGGETSNFKIGFAAGKRYFWRLFALGLFLGLFFFAILIILLIPIIFLFASQSYILGTILTVAGVLLFIPLVLLASFLKTYGQLYIVLGELTIWPAIENAYTLFLKNPGASLIMFLISVITGLIVGFAMLIALIPVVIVFALLGFIASLLFQSAGLAIIIGFGILTAIILLLAARSVYETFAQAVWIIFFQEIATPKETETVAETVSEITPVPDATPDPITFSEE